jgi:hypothetical protein
MWKTYYSKYENFNYVMTWTQIDEAQNSWNSGEGSADPDDKW